MSNVTTVAVTNSFNDTVTMLPPSANIDGLGMVIFHNNPRLEFDGANISSNFDHHIDFKIAKNKLHQELLGESYNHYPRLKRRTQYLNVFQFNKGRSPEQQITIPHYYMATLREGEHVRVTNFGIPNCEKVVIKEQLGARGSNQVVVPTNMLTTLLKHAKDKTLGEVSEMFPDLIYTDNSNWEMKFFEEPSELFISELITNVKSEYRLLVGGNKIYGRERVIKAGPYPQANLEVDKFHTVQEVTYEPIEDMFDEALVKTLYEFVAYIDLPIGSVDLYSTTDGTWGIFEYSTQFAFHGASPTFIRQLLLDGVKQVLLRNRIVPAPAQWSEPSSTELKSVIAGVPVKYTGNVNNVINAVYEPLTELVSIYDQFIKAINESRINQDSIVERSKSTGISMIQINAAPNNLWSYVLHAGNLTLAINLNSPYSSVLLVQGYVIDDFINVCDREIIITDEIKDLVNKIHKTISLISKEHTLAVNPKTFGYADLLDHALLTAIFQLEDIITLIDAPSVVHNIISYDPIVHMDDGKWVHKLNSERYELMIIGDSDNDETSVTINGSVKLGVWITNKLADRPDAHKVEVDKKFASLKETCEAIGYLNNNSDSIDTLNPKLTSLMNSMSLSNP